MAHNTNSIRLLDKTNLTIATGAITPTQLYHQVTSESGTTDDLTTINTSGFPQLTDSGNTYRPMIILYAAAGHTITVKHGTGDVYLNGATDFTLTGEKQVLLFHNGSNWSDVGASPTAAGDMLAATYDAAGVSEQLAGLTAAQTFTNKTIDHDANTLINIGNATVARISGSTFSTIQHLQDIFHSAGVSSGGAITDDADGTISVSAGTGFIRSTNDVLSTIFFYDWAAENGANVVLTDNAMNYIYVEYNSGSPQAIATITLRTDEQTNNLLGTVYRSGTELHITEGTRIKVGDHAFNMVDRLRETMPFARATGGIVSETGTRNLGTTAGVWWEGLTKFTTSAIDTSVADAFTYYYADGASGWTSIPSSTQFNNTQYDNGTGTLATLSNNLYGVHWIYIGTDDDVYVLYGTTNGTLTAANDAGIPSSVPPWFGESHTKLIGKAIIKKSAAALTSMQSTFNSVFSLESATDHGGLTGLADDDHTQYTLISSGTVAPSSTPSRVGLLYVATVANTWYISTGNSSSADWTIRSSGGGGASSIPSTFNGRITLSSTLPITTTDVTAATTVYLLPYQGETISLYDGSTEWVDFALGASGISASLSGLTADSNYDIYVFDSSGLTLETVIWTNDTTRATALVLQDGIYVKTGTTTKRYVGTIRITATTGQCEDSVLNRFCWNEYNRVPRVLEVITATVGSAYSTDAWRSWMNDTATRCEIVVGHDDVLVDLLFLGSVNAESNRRGAVGIGLDSTTTNNTVLVSSLYHTQNGTDAIQARYKDYPTGGYHYLQCLERATSGAVVTFEGSAGIASVQCGASGEVLG